MRIFQWRHEAAMIMSQNRFSVYIFDKTIVFFILQLANKWGNFSIRRKEKMKYFCKYLFECRMEYHVCFLRSAASLAHCCSSVLLTLCNRRITNGALLPLAVVFHVLCMNYHHINFPWCSLPCYLLTHSTEHMLLQSSCTPAATLLSK